MATQAKQTHKLRNDLIFIIVLLVVLAVAGACLFFLRGEGSAVTVKVNQAVFGVYPLTENRVVDIPSPGGGHNRLIIQDGKVFMESATCPDGICVGHHPIHRQGESIVCLPNRVVASITEDTPDAHQPDIVI